MVPASRAAAGAWGTDPVVGLTGDYATNPALLYVAHTTQSDAAVLLDAPTDYVADNLKLTLLPSLRLGDTKSYSSVNSNYEHLNVRSEYATERSSLTAMAGVSRDTSLSQDYLSNGAVGVRRDGALADLAWQRALTENVSFNASADVTRVRYATPAGAASLTDYRYTSLAQSLSWTAGDKTRLDIDFSEGRYNSLDGSTESRNGNLQLGLTKSLTPLWTLTASGGVSRALNQLQFYERFYIYLIPVSVRSSQTATVYSFNLQRQAERLQLTMIATLQEVPTGFALLSRQNNLEVQANYALSARWTLGSDLRYLRSEDPSLTGGHTNRDLRYATLSATWQWTEHCTLTMAASRVSQRYLATDLQRSSTQVDLTLSRKFNHLNFQ